MPVRLSLDDCRHVAGLMVQEFQASGWTGATFQVQDDRRAHGGSVVGGEGE